MSNPSSFRFTHGPKRGILPPRTPRRRIVFTGEILQTAFDGRPTMATEIHWLANLMRYQVSKACPATPLEVTAWEPSGASRFDGAHFYQLNGMHPGVGDWSRLVDADSITAPAADYLNWFFSGALVVGLGMSNWMLKFLNERGIPYLDFILHPARFMDDIFFGVRTNCGEIYRVLEEFACDEQAIELTASLHRASLLRMKPCELPPDTGLFAAQSGIDKALVCDGRFMYPEDYRREISEFLQRHACVCLKPHPYNRDGGRIVALLRSLAGDSARIRIVNDNVYQLLAHPNISEVCGISSSVVYEAEYFGKRATYLAKNRMSFRGSAGGFDPWKYVPVHGAYFNPGFWSRALASICDVADCRDVELPSHDNRLRNNLQVYWGYGFLEFEVPLRGIGIYPAPPPVDPAPVNALHEAAVQLYDNGRFDEAAERFAAVLMREETAEYWNDWSVAQLAAGHSQEAVDGFRMALRMSPGDSLAESNLQAALATRPAPDSVIAHRDTREKITV